MCFILIYFGNSGQFFFKRHQIMDLYTYIHYLYTNYSTHCKFSVIIHPLVWFFYLCPLHIQWKKDLCHWKPCVYQGFFSSKHLSIYSVIHISACTQILPKEEDTVCSNRTLVFDGAGFIIHIFVLFYKWQCPSCSVSPSRTYAYTNGSFANFPRPWCFLQLSVKARALEQSAEGMH